MNTSFDKDFRDVSEHINLHFPQCWNRLGSQRSKHRRESESKAAWTGDSTRQGSKHLWLFSAVEAFGGLWPRSSATIIIILCRSSDAFQSKCEIIFKVGSRPRMYRMICTDISLNTCLGIVSGSSKRLKPKTVSTLSTQPRWDYSAVLEPAKHFWHPSWSSISQTRLTTMCFTSSPKPVRRKNRNPRTFYEPCCPSFSTRTRRYTAMLNPCIQKAGVPRQTPTSKYTLRLSLPLQRPQEWRLFWSMLWPTLKMPRISSRHISKRKVSREGKSQCCVLVVRCDALVLWRVHIIRFEYDETAYSEIHQPSSAAYEDTFRWCAWANSSFSGNPCSGRLVAVCPPYAGWDRKITQCCTHPTSSAERSSWSDTAVHSDP